MALLRDGCERKIPRNTRTVAEQTISCKCFRQNAAMRRAKPAGSPGGSLPDMGRSSKSCAASAISAEGAAESTARPGTITDGRIYFRTGALPFTPESFDETGAFPGCGPAPIGNKTNGTVSQAFELRTSFTCHPVSFIATMIFAVANSRTSFFGGSSFSGIIKIACLGPALKDLPSSPWPCAPRMNQPDR